jgi:hypothetical protein
MIFPLIIMGAETAERRPPLISAACSRNEGGSCRSTVRRGSR